MPSKSPFEFEPALTDARLRVIADVLLEVLYETDLELDTELDDGYTRGTATFGRQRNAIIQLCLSDKYDWLKLTNAGMDVTFEISGVPCRFFADDASNPKKPGFWRRNDADLFPGDGGKPEIFRFIVDKARVSDEASEVYFIGFNAQQEEVFRWCHSTSAPVLASVDDALPKEVPLPAAKATIPRPAANDQSAEGEGTHGKE
jgi:hypothetical protein